MSTNSSEAAISSSAAPKKRDWLGYAMRIAIIALIICLFIPAINPARMSALVNNTASFFTTRISYDGLTSGFGRAIKKAWIDESVLIAIWS